jgi:hypothetical protein
MMMVLIHSSSYPMGGKKFSMFENLHICEKEKHQMKDSWEW